MRDYGFTLLGALMAAGSGAALGAGYDLVQDPSISNELVLRRAKGGALFC